MVEYNKFAKEYVKKDGRRLVASGPRDRQVRASNNSYVIADLQNQVKELVAKLEAKKGTVGDGEFTPEEVDNEINKAVTHAVAETEDRFKNKISNLEKENKKLRNDLENIPKKDDSEEIKILNEKIEALKNNVTSLETTVESKNEIIEILKNQLDKKESSNGISTEDLAKILKSAKAVDEEDLTEDARPQIKTSFVDPLDKDAGSNLESHVKIDEDKAEGAKDKLSNRVNKWKKVMPSPLQKQ